MLRTTLLLTCLVLTSCTNDGDDGDWVEAGADGKADGTPRPPPDGDYRVDGARHYGGAISEAINGGRYEVIASSGVPDDGYYSWDTYRPEVEVQPNANGTITVDVDGNAGVLRPGINAYSHIYSGQLGTAENGVYVHKLIAQRWNTVTNVVDSVFIQYHATTTTIVESKRWLENPRRQVTVLTKTVNWNDFDTGKRPGLHR